MRLVSDAVPQIGTLREKPLHASLKRWYSRPGDRIEEPVDGFVIDLVRGDLLVEIQTRGFSSMKRKLVALLDLGHRIRIVHPIPVDRWIVKIDAEHLVLSRRLSPKHGSALDLFAELVSFPELMAHEGLEIEVLLTREEELRRFDPNGPWSRKGWAVVERRLVEVVDSLQFRSGGDLGRLIPDDLPDTFTTADLAERLGRRRRAAQQAAYCLKKADVIAPVDKVGNSVVYRVTDGHR